MKRLLWALALSLLIPACRPAPVPAQVVQTVVYKQIEVFPTAYHIFIYTQMEMCTGIKGDLSKVRWWMAEGITVEYQDGTRGWAAGLHRKVGNGTFDIILTREHVFDGETVSHEVLHNLYQGDAPLDVAQHCLLTTRTLQAK